MSGEFDPDAFDADAFLNQVLADAEFERAVEGVELEVPEGACPRCLARTVWLNRLRYCGRCGWTEQRPGTGGTAGF